MRAERLMTPEMFREIIGKPSQDEVNEMMQNVHPGVVVSSIECVSWNIQQMLAFSLQLKSQIRQQEGVEPSRRRLSVGILEDQISDKLKRSFGNAALAQDIPSFRFYFDMAIGFTSTLGVALTTENLTGEDKVRAGKEYMDFMKQSRNHPFLTPEYVIAGGKLAIDLYKWTYEIVGTPAISPEAAAA